MDNFKSHFDVKSLNTKKKKKKSGKIVFSFLEGMMLDFRVTFL